MHKLSENFYSNELTISKDYPELAKVIKPTLEQILAAQILALSVLQPGRDKFGIFDMLSWIRSDELNKAVGGSPSSDHLTGNAGDFCPRNFNPETVFKWYVLESNVDYRQIIYYPDQSFIHASSNHPEKTRKHDALICTSKGVYVPFEEYYND